ncbi:MAG: hypothetical protein MUF05_06605 [Candidatus Omnitrophica bacterium]|jgi:hypothetical protein|nr:hypothetical protein [Candidatus Omnitrophota bacterium]
MKNKAQSIMEYVVMIGVVAIAIFSMTVYFKRGVQGSLRNTAGQISDGGMYSPGATVANSRITRKIAETSTSYTNPADSSSGSVLEANKSISESSTRIEQNISKDESVGDFSQEPQR